MKRFILLIVSIWMSILDYSQSFLWHPVASRIYYDVDMNHLLTSNAYVMTVVEASVNDMHQELTWTCRHSTNDEHFQSWDYTCCNALNQTFHTVVQYRSGSWRACITWGVSWNTSTVTSRPSMVKDWPSSRELSTTAFVRSLTGSHHLDSLSRYIASYRQRTVRHVK